MENDFSINWLKFINLNNTPVFIPFDSIIAISSARGSHMAGMSCLSCFGLENTLFVEGKPEDVIKRIEEAKIRRIKYIKETY